MMKDMNHLGEGTFGKVYLTSCPSDGSLMAVKKFKDTDVEEFYQEIVREFAALHTLDHPNIVKPIGVKFDGESICLNMEYVPGTLKEYIAKIDADDGQIPEDRVRSIMHQMLLGLEYCHSRGMIHRDLKWSNVLYNPESNIVKLADFGASVTTPMIPVRLEPRVGSLYWRAPELLNPEVDEYDCEGDIWSLGCIFAELCRNNRCEYDRFMFEGMDDDDQLALIFTLVSDHTQLPDSLQCIKDANVEKMADLFARYPKQTLREMVPEGFMDEVGFDLLSKMLELDPTRRITARDALRHPYFGNLRLPPRLPDLPGNLHPYMHARLEWWDRQCESRVVSNDYMKYHPNITEKCRAILINWLVSVCRKYRLLSGTFMEAVSIIDRYIAKTAGLVISKYQLLGIAAMHIAANMVEYWPLSAKELCRDCDDNYKPSELVEMVKSVLTVLKFDVTPCNSDWYQSVFSYCGELTIEHRLAQGLAWQFSLSGNFSTYTSKQVTLAATYLALCACGKPWPRSLRTIARLEEFRDCLEAMRKKSDHPECTAVIDWYKKQCDLTSLELDSIVV